MAHGVRRPARLPCPIGRLESSNLRRQRPTTSHAGSVAVACTNHCLPLLLLVHPSRQYTHASSSPAARIPSSSFVPSHNLRRTVPHSWRDGGRWQPFGSETASPVPVLRFDASPLTARHVTGQLLSSLAAHASCPPSGSTGSFGRQI
jgi:hypothetical protein